MADQGGGHDKYTVETEYVVGDKASAAAQRIEKGFKAVAHEVHGLKDRFREFRMESGLTSVAMLGVGFGLGSMIEKFKEVVGETTRAKKSIAGLFSESLNWPKAIDGVERYRLASKLADDATESLEETVADYGGSLDEASQGFRGLTAAVGQAHLKPKQLMDLYKMVAATAKATSTDIGTASELVGRAIMKGQVRPVGVLGKEIYQVLNAHGKLTKKMSVSGRMGLITEMMKGQKPIAEEMSKGIGDSLRKIQHSVNKVFREVGTPLFAAISKELNSWAKSLTQAGEGAKPIAQAFGEKLVDAFHVAKDVTSFLVDHWKQIAVIWGSFKLTGMAGSAGGFLGRIGEAVGGNVGGALSTFGKGLAGATAKLGLFAAAVTGAYMAGQAFGEFLMSKVDKRIDLQSHAGSMAGATKILESIAAKGVMTPQLEKFATKALKDLEESGTVRNGKIDRGAMLTNIGYLDNDQKRKLATDLGIGNKNLPVSAMAATQFADALTARLEPLLATFSGAPKKAVDATKVDLDNIKTKGVQIGPFTGNINITQKFDDVDPDRVWVATRRGIQENAERSVQSMHADPWGE